ncbi:DUF2318 domain-containing protein [archaeon]|jgi:uncharacterized membrane protein|nr:DUF2318 domain-containing protein [archaeon]
MNKKVLTGIIVVLAIVLAFVAFTNGSPTGKAIETTDMVKIPITGISSKAAFYEHEGSNYFVVKATDGSIKTAFDACDVCGGAKGYRQEGSDMVCNNCGRHFAISSLGQENIFGGGCWPSHLEHEVEGDYIVIQKSDLAGGSFRF